MTILDHKEHVNCKQTLEESQQDCKLNVDIAWLLCPTEKYNRSHDNRTQKMKARVNFSDKVAYKITMFLCWIADTFFKKRYGHRAVVLETVAGVSGMVAGMWNHLRSLRKMKPDDRGWIKTLLAEAENERMHLMIFIRIAKPNWFERWMIITAQFIFFRYPYVCTYFFRNVPTGW